ncbi:MAG: IS1595 family transposase [Terriglobia bacterium]
MSESQLHPVGGVDYPRTIQEFERWFPSEEACTTYLHRLRWPEGFRCPACGAGHAWMTARGLFRCAACQRQSSPIAGTIFEGTRKPLRAWFEAMWFVTNQKSGGSALGLQRILGLGSYQTAWAWLHKLRRAMVRPGRDRLTGRVEVDETYLGGPEKDVYGRQAGNKILIVVAAQEDGKGIGRIRVRSAPDASAESLIPFVEDSIEPGSVVHTDAWLGYEPLERKGYQHQITFLRGHRRSPSELLPRVHRVVSLLKRWLMSTHQGAVSHEHLDYYLDEFTFRFNRRRSKARGLLFYRLLQQAVEVAPVPYHRLIGGKADHNI